MAKSIRSKRKRKLRAIKRVRYAAKELVRLKKTLGINDDTEMKDEILEVPNDVVTAVDGNVIEFSLKEKKKEKSRKQDQVDVDSLKIGEAEAFLRENERENVVTVKDVEKLNGKFPKWMNHRQIRKVAGALRRAKNKSKRIAKKRRMGK